MSDISFYTKPIRDFSFMSQTELFPKSKLLIFVLTVCVLTFILSGNYIWKQDYEVDKSVNKNLYAINDFSITDEKSTNDLLKKTIQQLKPGLIKDENITKNNATTFKNLIQTITEVRISSKDNQYIDFNILSRSDQDYIISLSYEEWEKNIYNNVIDLSSYFLTNGIPNNSNIFNKYADLHLKNDIEPNNRKLIKNLVRIALYTNLNKDSILSETSNSNYSKIKSDIRSRAALISNKKQISMIAGLKTDITDSQKQTMINQLAYFIDVIEKNRITSRFDNIVYEFLPDEISSRVTNLTDADWASVKSLSENAFYNIQKTGYTEFEADTLKTNVYKYLPDSISKNKKELIYLLIKKSTKPNIIVDSKELANLKSQAKNSIEPIKINFKKGQLLVKKGDILSEDQLEILQASGLVDKEIDWNGILNVLLFVNASVIIFLFISNIIQKDFIKSTNNLWFMSLTTIVITGLSYIASIANASFIPLCVLCALVSMFLSRKIAVVALFTLTILYYQFLIVDQITFLTIFISCIISIYLFHKITQRIYVLKYGFILGISQIVTVNFITLLSDSLIKNERFIAENFIIIDSIFWLTSGIVFSMMILAITPLIEEVFGLLTYSRLTELGDFNQPVLAELEERAPGTFQHSLAVATLSEFAAKKLNLDSTFCRVGAYYHDIGKLMKPEYYVENQFDKANPHDVMDNPTKSARIIISHSRAGVVIAKKHKLPQSIINFIVEHHGSSLVAYFYHKAKKKVNNEKDVDEELFRYYGPKPQSKETAITMLADASEAAARAIKDKSRLSVKNKVKDIITEKMNDGQLSESGLELEEIAIIIESFTTVIMDFYHNRIEYPSGKKS